VWDGGKLGGGRRLSTEGGGKGCVEEFVSEMGGGGGVE